jgi:hypothetical protein
MYCVLSGIGLMRVDEWPRSTKVQAIVTQNNAIDVAWPSIKIPRLRFRLLPGRQSTSGDSAINSRVGGLPFTIQRPNGRVTRGCLVLTCFSAYKIRMKGGSTHSRSRSLRVPGADPAMWMHSRYGRTPGTSKVHLDPPCFVFGRRIGTLKSHARTALGTQGSLLAGCED